jgi:hypothetical protein
VSICMITNILLGCGLLVVFVYCVVGLLADDTDHNADAGEP